MYSRCYASGRPRGVSKYLFARVRREENEALRARVYIWNPAAGSNWTSMRSACRYIEQGRARFTDAPTGYQFAIEFIKDENGRDVLMAHLEKAKRLQYDRGYDSRLSMLRRDELSALPFANLSAENYTRLISLQTKRSR